MPSPNPGKMNQFWVIMKSSFEPKTKIFNGDRKKHWNQKSPGRKRSVLKPQVGCSTFDKNFSEVRYAPKPILKWVHKCFC